LLYTIRTHKVTTETFAFLCTPPLVF